MKSAQEWTKIPTQATLNKTVDALKKRNFKVIVPENRTQAFEKLKEMIPAGAEVMTGSSTTLNQIGFMDYYVSGKNPWKCLGPEVFNEKNW